MHGEAAENQLLQVYVICHRHFILIIIKRYIEGESWEQIVLIPETLDDFIEKTIRSR